MGALHAFPSAINDESTPPYDSGHEQSEAPNTFAMIPASIFGAVDPGAVCVYAAIAQHAKPNGYAHPSVEAITNLIQTISRPTVMKHIQALADAGLVIISEHRRGSTRSFSYYLPMHPPVKKIYRSDNNDTPTGQESLPATGQKTLPVNDDRSKNLTGTGQKTLPVPVKNFDRNNKEKNIRVNADTQKEPTRIFQIVDWYTKRVDGALPGKGSREWQEAKRLAATSCTDEDLDEEFDWLSNQSWVESISLALMANKYNEWRSSKQTAKKQLPPNHPKSGRILV